MERNYLTTIQSMRGGTRETVTVYDDGYCVSESGKEFRITSEKLASIKEKLGKANKEKENAEKAVDVPKPSEETAKPKTASSVSTGLKASIVKPRSAKKKEVEEDDDDFADDSPIRKEPEKKQAEKAPAQTHTAGPRINPLIPSVPRPTVQSTQSSEELSEPEEPVRQEQPTPAPTPKPKPKAQTQKDRNEETEEEKEQRLSEVHDAIMRHQKMNRKNTQSGYSKNESEPYTSADSGHSEETASDEDIQILDIMPVQNAMTAGYGYSSIAKFVDPNETAYKSAVLPIDSYEACIYLGSEYDRFKHKGAFAYYLVPREGGKKRIVAESGSTDNEFEYAIYGIIQAFKDVLRNSIRKVIVITKDELTRDVLIQNAMNVQDSWDDTRSEYVKLMRKHSNVDFTVQFTDEKKLANKQKNIYMDIAKSLAKNALY